jgi:pimeloyl-ACP methyl ester carboxylesterase
MLNTREKSGSIAEATEDPLERAFERPDILTINGERVEVHDVAPEHPKTDIPTLFAPGWGITSRMHKYSILALAEAGRRAIVANAPHGVEISARTEASARAEDFPDAERRRIEAMLGTLEQKGIDKVDAIGHSEGGLDLILAATLYPEKFRNIVLVNPAGIIGKDNLLRLGIGFLKDSLTQAWREATAAATPEKRKRGGLVKGERHTFERHTFFRTLASQPLHTAREVVSMSDADILNMLKTLKEKGVGVSIVHTVNDKGFPMERVQQAVEAGMIDGFVSAFGTHNEIQIRPEKYTRAAEACLTAMEKKHAGQKNDRKP